MIAGLKAVLPLLGLDLLFMGVLLGAIGAAMALGFRMPQHALGGMELTAALAVIFVLVMPAGEEIFFRGWLSGRLGHLLGMLLSLPAFVGVLLWIAPRPGGGAGIDEVVISAVIAAFALLACAAIYLFRKRNAAAWYQRHFVWFYWLSALAFAVIHLTNFAAAGPTLLPLVLPQFALALILGYLRVKHGLWSAVLLHMLHNATFVGLMVVGSKAA